MTGDELANGPERAPLRLPPRLRIALVAVALVAAGAAGVLAVERGSTAPLPVAVRPPSPAPTSPAPRALIRVGEVCPVRTDGRSSVTVSFTVVNGTDVPAALIAAEPLLPLAGLSPDGSSLRGGTCAAPLPEPPGVLRRDGTGLLVTFRFRLPAECPAPYPVQATVFVREDHIESFVLPVLVDLGESAFDTCPRPG